MLEFMRAKCLVATVPRSTIYSSKTTRNSLSKIARSALKLGTWDLGLENGWPTGLEPATTRTTIWSSTIELRPPVELLILGFRARIAKAKRRPAWHALRFLLRIQWKAGLQLDAGGLSFRLVVA